MPSQSQPSHSSSSSARLARTRGQGACLAILLAAASLGVAGCGWHAGHQARSDVAPPALVQTVVAKPAAVQRAPGSSGVLRLADFGGQRASRDARHVADWALDSGDSEGKAFVLVDKKDARVYVFNPRGRLIAAAPALIGAAVGDDPVPGIGEKPLAEVLPDEKTTPAGRFVAEPGVNATGEDVVWVSWDLAVSMHRVRPLVKSERRLQRLASATAKDNRISFGCINLPVAFYEKVLRPTVKRSGAIVYVLPETRTPQEEFGSYDVRDRAQLAGVARAGVK